MREGIKKKRDLMSLQEVEGKSSAIAKKLMATEEYQKATAVLFYAAKGNEARTEMLIRKALGEGKLVLLPITNTAAKELEISEIKDYDSDLKKGAFGIMEPKGKTDADEKLIDAVIVPGVAFDREGHRLGHGHGYYDKLLHKMTKAAKIGLAYDFQVIEKLPRESHDHPMDVIVTESRVIRCK